MDAVEAFDSAALTGSSALSIHTQRTSQAHRNRSSSSAGCYQQQEQQQQRQRRRRGLVSDDAVPFSWTQCALSVCAYIWLLSNVLRTDVAIANLDALHALAPDQHINFGPYAYAGNTFLATGTDLRNVTVADPVSLWSYKFDTTSIAMRAFAAFLNVSAFPACVLYRGDCSSTDVGEFLTPVTGLRMLDALVDAIRDASLPVDTPLAMSAHSSTSHCHRLRPQALLLRATYAFFDRIHHYILPQLFSLPLWRTCHAVYYRPDQLLLVSQSSHGDSLDATLSSSSSSQRQQQEHHHAYSDSALTVDICSHVFDNVHPYFCDELWANYDRSCQPSDDACRTTGRVSRHIATRLSALRASYPNATVDMLVIESSEDIGIRRGGLTFVGRRGSDIVTLIRIRDCSTTNSNGSGSGSGASSETATCTTRVIDDYRYEGDAITTDVLQWTRIVVLLRAAAQSYYWVRVCALLYGCYVAAAATASASAHRDVPRSHSHLDTLRRALRIFFKIPSQVVVYGSAFPLACYLLAHVIDSPMVYEMIAQHFDSFNGLLRLSLTKLVTISSIQMRNVWLLGCAAHVVTGTVTHRSWSPLHGVWGMPQFSIALLSSLTVVSQFRFLALRRSPVVDIQPIQVTSRLHPVLESLVHVNGGGGKAVLAGVFLDVKALAGAVSVLAIATVAASLAIKLACPQSRLQLVVWRSYSVAPLSAGVLWSARALAVSWNDDLFRFHYIDCFLRQRSRPQVHPSDAHTLLHPQHPQEHEQELSRFVSQLPSRPVAMTTLDDRSEVVESAMYLMNIAMLSDPVVYLSWRWTASTTRLAYVRSNATQHVYLVPMRHTLCQSELEWKELELERIVCANEVSWTELITCG